MAVEIEFTFLIVSLNLFEAYSLTTMVKTLDTVMSIEMNEVVEGLMSHLMVSYPMEILVASTLSMGCR